MQSLNAAILILFTILIVVGGLRTLVRYFEYRHAGRKVPILLVRDMITRNGLGLSFLMVLFARTSGLELNTQLWWVLLSSAPAMLAAAIYAYFEFFIIDKVDGWSYRRRRGD